MSVSSKFSLSFPYCSALLGFCSVGGICVFASDSIVGSGSSRGGRHDEKHGKRSWKAS